MSATATAWPMVPSTPARSAYLACQALVSCWARAASRACWTSRERSVSWRPPRPAVVHWPRTGQAWQRGAGNSHHDRLGAALGAGAPGGAGLSLRAGRLLPVPVCAKCGSVEPASGPGLGGGVLEQGGDQGGAEGGQRADEQLRRGGAGVQVVLGGEQAAAGELPVGWSGHRLVGHGGVGGRHAGDDVGHRGGLPDRCGLPLLAGGGVGRARTATGLGLLAGLRDVHLVAVPEGVALAAPAGVGVIRRGQATPARREAVCVCLPPPDL